MSQPYSDGVEMVHDQPPNNSQPHYEPDRLPNLHPNAVLLIPQPEYTEKETRKNAAAMIWPREKTFAQPNPGGDLSKFPQAQEIINICKTTPWPPQQFVGNKADELYQKMAAVVGSDNILPPSGIQSEANQVQFLKTHVNALPYFYYKSPKYRKKIQKMLNTNACSFKYCPEYYTTSCFVCNWLCCPFTLMLPCCCWGLCGVFACGTAQCAFGPTCFQPDDLPLQFNMITLTGLSYSDLQGMTSTSNANSSHTSLTEFRHAFIQNATAAGFDVPEDNFDGCCNQHFCAPIYLTKYYSILSYYHSKRWGVNRGLIQAAQNNNNNNNNNGNNDKKNVYEPIDKSDQSMIDYLTAMNPPLNKTTSTNSTNPNGPQSDGVVDKFKPKVINKDGFKANPEYFAYTAHEAHATVSNPHDRRFGNHEPREVGWFGEWQMGRLKKTIGIHNYYWEKLHMMNVTSLNTGLIME